MMTREEAKDKVINYALGLKVNDGINTMEELIDKIYDEHDLEMKAKDERIAELEEAQLTRREWYQKGYNEAMKHKECCLICKNRSGCKFADNVRETFGINSNEMWFSCFKTKDIK